MPHWVRYWAMGAAVYLTVTGLVILSYEPYLHRGNLWWWLGPPLVAFVLAKLTLR